MTAAEMTAAFVADGEAINSGSYNGLSTPEFKLRITADLADSGLGAWRGQLQAPRLALQPAAILGRAVSDFARTGCARKTDRADARGAGRATAGRSAGAGRFQTARPSRSRRWKKRRRSGSIRSSTARRYKRETNTMPQWAGSCWYYLAVSRQQERQGAGRSGHRKSLDAGRSVHRRRGTRRAASALLAILAQGAVRSRLCQHAGAVHEAGESGHDPGRNGIHRLSQGRRGLAQRADVQFDDDNKPIDKKTEASRLPPCRVQAEARRETGRCVSCSRPIAKIRVDSRAYKMSKSRGNVVNPDEVVKEYGADAPAAVRNVHGPAGSHEAVEHDRRQRRARLFWTACGG